MKHADLIKRLIKEVLSTPPKKDSCNCGCHSCENVGNKGPVLNESLTAKVIMTENMQYHVKNKLAITENTFRYGSQAFLDLWAEARYLYSRNAIHLNEDDKEIILETNLGEYGMFEGKKVPLDLPMLEEDSELGGMADIEYAELLPYKAYSKLLGAVAEDPKFGVTSQLYNDLENLFDYGNNEKVEASDVEYILKRYGAINLLATIDSGLNEADKKKKNPPLNKPKRGGSKKFYVYVRKPGGGIKKVSFGQAGMSAKINNPEARRAFAARHKCAQKTDKTKASYWSCRLPRYASLLGLKSNFSGFW